MKRELLGVKVDDLSRDEVVHKISDWLGRNELSCRMLFTAYSEFFVRASRDGDFLRVLNSADLVSIDGVSVSAAIEFEKVYGGQPLVKRLLGGLRVGLNILNGKYSDTVSGVYLFDHLTELSSRNDWKVFLLGGWGGVSERTAKMLLKRFPGLRVDYDSGEEVAGKSDRENNRIVAKINKFKPDILFVAYSPVVQEKWIYENRKQLKTGLAIGVGGTFDEYVGDFPKAPLWMEKMGLKWLWRLKVQPFRWKRMIDAVLVFPWMVLMESVRKV